MEVEDILNYMLIAAVVAAFVLFVTGRYLDLTVDRQTSVQERASINLLQKIVTEGPILVIDVEGNGMKLQIDKKLLSAADLSGCCDSVQYDYKFDIGSFKSVERPNGKQPFYNAESVSPSLKDFDTTGPGKGGGPGSSGGWGDYDISNRCYSGFGMGTAAGAKVPVNICERRSDVLYCDQGIAAIETLDTPLSQMAYWITAICKSDFDVAKRIPLATGDYAAPNDIVISNEQKKICIGNSCKRFYCDAEIGNKFDSSLMGEDVDYWVTHLCNFVIIAKEKGKMVIYEGLESAPFDPSLTDFPKDHDAWTEDDAQLHFSPESGFFVSTDPVPENIVSGSDVLVKQSGDQRGSKYVALRSLSPFPSPVDDKSTAFRIGDLFKKFEDDKEMDLEGRLDCEDKGYCIDMTRGYSSINFRAMLLPNNPSLSGTKALLTWKLTDDENHCIERDYTKVPDFFEEFGRGYIGEGKTEITNEWTDVSIDMIQSRASAEMEYGDCNGGFFGTSLLGTGPMPEFTWRITKIEFNACKVDEKNPLANTCNNLEIFDDRQGGALLIDNLYFKAVTKEESGEEDQ